MHKIILDEKSGLELICQRLLVMFAISHKHRLCKVKAYRRVFWKPDEY